MSLANEVKENRHNVKVLWDEIGLNKIKLYLSVDHKMNNLVLGLQPHSLKFPCHICTAANPKSNGTDWEKGELRTLGSIRKQCSAWRNSGGLMKQACNFQSCTSMPMFDDSDDTLTLSLCPLSELHILLRIFNHIFHHFDQEWKEEIDTTERNFTSPAMAWAMSCGAVQKNFHGKVFNGFFCNRLLSSDALHRLERSLPLGPLLGFLDTFRKLAKVKDACFGKNLHSNFSSKILEFKIAFLALGIKVTPCTHILFAHADDFFNLTASSESKKRGLGIFSEQCFETMHSTVQKALDRFPANKFSDKFPKRTLRAMCFLNSAHL